MAEATPTIYEASGKLGDMSPDIRQLVPGTRLVVLTNLHNPSGARIPIEGSLAGLALLGNHTLVCNDTEEDPRVDREACRKMGLRSAVIVPLFGRGNISGLLEVETGYWIYRFLRPIRSKVSVIPYPRQALAAWRWGR